MNTFSNTNAPAGQSTALFHVYISEQQVVEESLDIQSPIYLIVSGLTHRHQLPTIIGGYGLFGGPDRRPISRELSLESTPYAGGGELYLAAARAPWWVPAAAMPAPASGAARPPTRSIPARPSFSVTPKVAALAALGIVSIALVGFLLWPRGDVSADTGTPAITIQAPSPVVAAPTATLLPATPTIDPATLAERSYQGGRAAYDERDWATAAGLLQAVYDYNPAYLDIGDLLSATYYNWGVAARDQGDVAAAQDHFQAAMTINPNHQLAPAELAKAALFLEAGQAAAGGDTDTALDKYRELLKLSDGSYVQAAGQLYELLIAQAADFAQSRDAQSLRAAYGLYNEAASLNVSDRSVAEQGSVEVAARLPKPTPTPKPVENVEKKLRFRVLNYNDDPSCISVQISGITPAGWYFSVDGIRGVTGRFDSGGNARACGVGPGQEVTITVIDGNGRAVAGGAGVPAKGSAIMGAAWK